MKQISLEEFNQNKGKFDIIETTNIDFFDKDNTVPRIIDFCTKKNDKHKYRGKYCLTEGKILIL